MYNRNRNSRVETSYTGVGAFSSAHAPDSNALAAASVIGNALKANNHNPNNLSLPKLQSRSTAAERASRANSIVTANARNNSLTARNSISATGRNNSINTANARRSSISAVPKQRLQNQKSAPNLAARRSISDLTPRVNYSANVPRTIKKYVPSARGLVAVEVPNPKHPDNISGSSTARRSLSIGNFNAHSSTPSTSRRSLVKQQYSPSPKKYIQTQSLKDKQGGSQSITKNIKRETKILPDGTKVISTTVEQYITNDGTAYDDVDGEGVGNYEGFDNDHYGTAYDDSYDDFLDEARQVDMSVTLDEIHEDEDEDENAHPANGHNYNNVRILDELEKPEKIEEEPSRNVVTEIAEEEKYEEEVKKIIENNERIENTERELAYESSDRPVVDTVIMEDELSRGIVKHEDEDTSSLQESFDHSSIEISSVPVSEQKKTSEIKENTDVAGKEVSAEESADFQLPDVAGAKTDSHVGVTNATSLDTSTHAPEILPEFDGAQQNAAISKEIDPAIGQVADADFPGEDNDDDEGSFVNDITDSQDLPEVDYNEAKQSQYTEEEYLLAQKKLEILVDQKKQELLAELERNGQLEGVRISSNENEDDEDEETVPVILPNEEFDNSTNYSVCSNDTEMKNSEIPPTTDKLEQINAKQVPAQEVVDINHYVAPSAIPLQSSENLSNEKFFTPPVTPPIVIAKGPSEELMNKASPVTESETQRSMTSFKRSESPESSIVKDSYTSITEPLKNTESHHGKSMAQHLRQMVAPVPRSATNANQPESIEVDELVVPKREPAVQAQLDIAEKNKPIILEELHTSNNDNNIESGAVSSENLVNLSPVHRKKSVLKNGQNRSPVRAGQQSNASGAYLSITTAENTKLNAQSSISDLNRGQNYVSQLEPISKVGTRSRSGSAISANQPSTSVGGIAPLAAAAKAAQRHSAQPGSLMMGATGNNSRDAKSKRSSTIGYVNSDLNGNASPLPGSVKAPNPKVEEAKKRILSNRPGQKRAKELYAMAKTRSQIKPEDLRALQDPTVPRRSSFEKERENDQSGSGTARLSMVSMSLRDINGLNYDKYEQRKPTRGYKSRFADDNSDTDIPLPPIQPTTVPVMYSDSVPTSGQKDALSPAAISTAPEAKEKGKSGFRFKISGKKSKKDVDVTTQPSSSTAPRKESKFEKFFTEQHGPGKRVTSTASAVSEAPSVQGKKKRGFFKKMFNDNE